MATPRITNAQDPFVWIDERETIPEELLLRIGSESSVIQMMRGAEQRLFPTDPWGIVDIRLDPKHIQSSQSLDFGLRDDLIDHGFGNCEQCNHHISYREPHMYFRMTYSYMFPIKYTYMFHTECFEPWVNKTFKKCNACKWLFGTEIKQKNGSFTIIL